MDNLTKKIGSLESELNMRDDDASLAGRPDILENHLTAVGQTVVNSTRSTFGRKEIPLRSPEFSCDSHRPNLANPPRNSLKKSVSGVRRRESGERPRVLLLVPPYTRLKGRASLDSPLRSIGIDTFEVMKRAGTPIGLLRIGTTAKSQGYEVCIIDAPFEGWHQEEEFLQISDGEMLYRYGLSDDQIRHAIESFNPDVVGIQCSYTVQWGNARALADLVKSLNSDLVVVGGGAHCSGDWQNALSDSSMDVIVQGEADVTFHELLKALTTSEACIDHVSGIRYRQNDRLVSTGDRPYMNRRMIHELPPLDLGLLRMGLYKQPHHSAGERRCKDGAWAQTFATIGCNVKCDFCYIPKINGPWRSLGLDWFDRHLTDLRTHGVSELLIEDDHLLHDPEHALQIFNLLEKHRFPWVEEGGLSLFNLLILHQGENFIESMNKNDYTNPIFTHAIHALRAGITARTLIQAMARSGCYSVYLAVESANEKSLKHSNKPAMNAMQQATAEIVALFAEAGIQVTGGFMLGFVNPPRVSSGLAYVESLEEMERTIDYAKLLMGAGMTYANPFIVTPIPGTPLWEYQKNFAQRNYDTGWSHERATMGTDFWNPEMLDNMRLKLLVEVNGPEKVRSMFQRGTWPVTA